MRKYEKVLHQMNLIANWYQNYSTYLNSKRRGNKREKGIAIKYVNNVFQSFIKLEEREKNILNNEFFSPLERKWWKKYYSDEEYKTLLISSINHFLEAFNHHEY